MHDMGSNVTGKPLSKVTQSPPYLTVTFISSYYNCNLACPYCITDWKRRSRDPSEPGLREIFDGINRIPRPVSLVNSQMGEFFLSNELQEETIRLCNTNNNLVGITLFTNLRADWNRIVRPFAESVNPARLTMICTLHDTVIPERQIDIFFDKAGRLISLGIDVCVTHLVQPGRVEFTKAYKHRSDEIGARFSVFPLQAMGAARGDNTALRIDQLSSPFSSDELADIKPLCESPHMYHMYFGLRTTYGSACGAGRDYIHIAPSGEVFTCLALKCKGAIGNIIGDDVGFLAKDKICPIPFCSCPHEVAALRMVDQRYQRGRDSRMLTPKPDINEAALDSGYPMSLYRYNIAQRLFNKAGKAVSQEGGQTDISF